MEVDVKRACIKLALVILGCGLGAPDGVASGSASVVRTPITEVVDRSWLAASEYQPYPGTYLYPEHPAAAGSYLYQPPKAFYRVQPKDGEQVVHTPYSFVVHLPQGYGAPDRRWPLIVVLPDRSESNRPLAQASEDELLRYVREQALPFMVLIPRCPELEWWQTDAVKACIDQALASYAVDPNRIYATGYGSMGGFGVWALAVKYPDLFAAIAPVAGIAPISGNSYHDRDRNLTNVPVWIFQGAADTTVPLACLQREAATLQMAGANVKLTAFPGLGHNAWASVYRHPALYDWFLKNSRALPSAARPRVADEPDPPSVVMRTPEIVQWPQGRQAVATLTFDDGLPSHATVVAPLLEKYGWRGTFFIWPVGNGNMTWDQLRKMATRGHEIGNHCGDGVDEVWDTTLPASRDRIDRELPMQRVVSHAYSGGDLTGCRAAARYFVSARRLLGLEQTEPADLYTLHCWFTDGFTRQKYDEIFDVALEYRGWALLGQHDVTAEMFVPQLESLKARQDRLWIAPQRDVVAYIRERRFTTLRIVSQDSKTVRLSVICGLPGDLYHFPLTLAVPLPEGWESATARQNGKPVWQQWREAQRLLYFDAVPNAGDVTIRKKL